MHAGMRYKKENAAPSVRPWMPVVDEMGMHVRPDCRTWFRSLGYNTLLQPIPAVAITYSADVRHGTTASVPLRAPLLCTGFVATCICEPHAGSGGRRARVPGGRLR